MSIHSSMRSLSDRRGVALVAVLYFLVVCALASTAVLFARRTTQRNALNAESGTRLLAAAEEALNTTLGQWSSTERSRQALGSTVVSRAGDARIGTTTSITRLSLRLFSITSEARLDGSNIARRVNLLVRLPLDGTRVRAALISAVGVTIGPDVRFVTDSAPCDTPAAALILAPNAAVAIDAGIPSALQPSTMRDSLAADSSTYLRIADTWWSELAQRADIRLAADTHIIAAPSVTSGQCNTNDANWGDPLGVIVACATRTPLVYVAGDLTIDGGVGQGVLLVDGHLAIAGPFTFSGQIVARRGIETLADNITISGTVYAWSASSAANVSHALTSDVRLTHATTLRYSGCDARHGIASWLQPRPVRERAWSELF